MAEVPLHSIRNLALYARAHMGLVPEVLSDAALEMLQTPRVYTSREQSSMSRRYRGTVRDASARPVKPLPRKACSSLPLPTTWSGRRFRIFQPRDRGQSAWSHSGFA